MSGFSDLVGNGAECGPGNGITGLMKQFNKDHSLEQDRFGPSQASSSKQAFRQTFRQQGPAGSAPPPGMMAPQNAMSQQTHGPGSFNFAEMHRELNGVQSKPVIPHTAAPAPAAGDWSADFARHQHQVNSNGHVEMEHAFARAGPMNMRPLMVSRPMAGPQSNWADQFHHHSPAAAAAAAATTTSVAQSTSAVPASVTQMRPDPMALAFNEARMYSMMGPRPPMMMHHHQPQFQTQQKQQVGEMEQQQEVASNENDLAKTAAQILDSVSDTANPKFKNSEFFSFMQQLADGQATIDGDQVVTSSTDSKGKQAEAATSSGPTWATEFEKRADDLVNREAEAATEQKNNSQIPADGRIFSDEFAPGLERNWAEEFELSLDGPLKETNVSGHPQEMDVKLDEPSSKYIHGEASQDWLEQFKDKLEPMLSEQDKEWLDTQKEWESLNTLESSYRAVAPELNMYNFQRSNYYEDMTQTDLKETIQQMKQNPESASLGDTILALESAVSQNPQDARMWLQLGLKQQENEQEQAAIAALRKAISLDSDALDAHLALAVSYTNEGYQMDAYDELHEWIARHDRYKSLVPPTAAENMTNSESRKDYVQDLYIKAARMSPGQDWDPDVQVALGVLFNISTEYSKAVDCFKAALSKRPDDYILWNRLGATEAHVGKNKEATAAYFRALELHPSFIRARYNLSLASTNMGQHREAAENCLIALSLQQREMQAMDEKSKAAAGSLVSAGGMSSTIWNALQLSMYMLGETSLAEACEKHDLDAFRAKFDF